MREGCGGRPSKKVLLIEGNGFIRSALQYTLEASGLAVHAVESGEDGLCAVSQDHLDVVICSHHLPGMNGLEFFSKAMASLYRATTILTAAFAENYLVNEAHAAGVGIFMEKPFRVECLLACIDDHPLISMPDSGRSHVYYNNWRQRVSIAYSDTGGMRSEMQCAPQPVPRSIHLAARQWKLYLNNRKLDHPSISVPPHLELIKQ